MNSQKLVLTHNLNQFTKKDFTIIRKRGNIYDHVLYLTKSINLIDRKVTILGVLVKYLGKIYDDLNKGFKTKFFYTDTSPAFNRIS